MKTKWRFLILFIGLLTMLGCTVNNSEPLDTKTHVPRQTENNIKAEFDIRGFASQLEIKDVYHIISSTINDLDKIIAKRQKENTEWFDIAIENAEKTTYTNEFKDASQTLQTELRPVLTADALDAFGDGLLITYFCACDSYPTWNTDDLNTRLTITEQDQDSFIATSLTLGNELNNEGFTNEWHFKKENDQWKLADYVYVSTDEQPLQLTASDIEGHFYDEKTNTSVAVFVDEIEVTGSQFIIVQINDNDMLAFHVDTGEINNDALSKYMETIQ